MRPLRITLTPGLPDAGATGQWLGCDARGAVYVLRWHPAQACWGALGFESGAPPARKPWAHLVLLRGTAEGFIIGHVEGPPILPAPAAAHLGEAISPPADAAPLWHGLLWPFLPALAATTILAFLFGATWLAGECLREPGRDPLPRSACWSWTR